MKSLLTDFLGRICSVCDSEKQSQRSFCLKCYRMLPPQMQQDLYSRFGAGYEQAFEKAKAWLLENPNAKPIEVPKINWPATSDELKKAGYEYDNDGVCRGCLSPIEWWLTPDGKRMPISVQKANNVLFDSSEKRISHFANCPEAKSFRR